MKNDNFPFPVGNKPSAAYMSAAKAAYATASLEAAKKKQAEDEDRAALLDLAVRSNVGLVHVFNKDRPRGGVTIAFRKVNEYKSTRMVEIAVAACSPADTFSKRIGSRNALNKFFDSDTIELPLLFGYEDEDVNGAVKIAFSKMFLNIYN